MTPWVLIAGCAFVLALPLAWRTWHRRFDPFEPIVLFALAWAAMFVVRPASILVTGERQFWGVDTRPTLPRALLLALVGAVAFVSGYETQAGSRLARRLPAPARLDAGVAAAAALAVAGVGLVALAVVLRVWDGLDRARTLLGGRSNELGELIGDASTYVWYGSLLLTPAAFVIIALLLRRATVFLAVAAAVTLTLALARVAPVGGRLVLLPLLGGVFVLVYVMRDRRPGALLLATVAVVAMFGSYFTLAYRNPTDDLTPRQAVERLADRPQAALDPLLHGADTEMVLALSGALTAVPDELSYRWGGATIGNLLARPVPRELWDGKPLPPGEEVVSTVWPEFYPDLDPAFSPLLVFYWDLGLLGVALGMLAFGVLARTLYDWFLLNRTNFGAQLLFSAGLWFVVIGARNDPVDTIVLGAFVVAPVLAIVTLASLPRRARSS